MAVTKYSLRRPGPSLWAELDSNRLSRMFDDSFFSGGAPAAWTPAVAISETQEELRLTAEVPGLALDNVTLEVENNVLTISGEKVREASRRAESGEDGDTVRYHVVERSYGSFKRSFTLPRTVDSSKIAARLEHGVLEVVLPKSIEAKGRTIEITG